MRTGRLWWMLLLGVLLLAGCTADDGPLADVGPVDVERFAAAVEDGAVVIDVRTPEETAEGVVPGALLLPIADDDFAEQVAALDPTQTYALYCRTENRSSAAREKLQAAGVASTVVLSGGFDAWAQSGRPTVLP